MATVGDIMKVNEAVQVTVNRLGRLRPDVASFLEAYDLRMQSLERAIGHEQGNIPLEAVGQLPPGTQIGLSINAVFVELKEWIGDEFGKMEELPHSRINAVLGQKAVA